HHLQYEYQYHAIFYLHFHRLVATSKGPRVLTADVVKNIADIEHLMAQAKS
ncbi:hypothetical protein ACFMJM_07500, partial [Acinetobacter baumannii]